MSCLCSSLVFFVCVFESNVENGMDHGFTTLLVRWYEAFKVHHERWSLWFSLTFYWALYSKHRKNQNHYSILHHLFCAPILIFIQKWQFLSVFFSPAWTKCDYDEIEFFPLNFIQPINLSIRWIYSEHKSIECNSIDAHHYTIFLIFNVLFFIFNPRMKVKEEKIRTRNWK